MTKPRMTTLGSAVTLGMGVLLASLALAQGAPRRQGFTVVQTNNRMGDLDPCGCPKRRLGGVARHVQHVADLRKQGPVLALDAGDAFFKEEVTPAQMRTQLREKADIIAHAYGKALDAFVPGAHDMAEGAAFMQDLVKRHAVPAVAANLVDTSGNRVFPPHVLRNVGDLRVLVVGAVDPELFPQTATLRATDPVSALRAVMAAAPPHDLAVLLASTTAEVASTWAQQVPHFTLVSTGGAGMLFFLPRTAVAAADGPVKHAAIIGSGKAGKYAGIGRVTLVDGNRDLGDAAAQGRARNMLVAALDRLKNRPDDAASATQRDESRAIIDAAEKQSHLLWDLFGFDMHLPEDPDIAARVAAYNARNADREAALAASAPPAPQDIPPSSPYVGSTLCGTCHQEALAAWQKMDHSRALKSLEKTGQHLDRECIGCHSVGWRQPGGFHDPARVGGFANVQCESCHGPGRSHVQNPKAAGKIQRAGTEATCRQCHTPDVTPQFDYPRDRLRIRHWTSAD